MNKAYVIWIVLALAISGTAQKVALPAATGERVWIWSPQCGDTVSLDVTIRLGSKELHHMILPICQGKRDSEDGRYSFNVSGSFLHQYGYPTRRSEFIEADLWQAGGDPDALILGFSLESGSRIHLNTLHVARPDRKVTSAIGGGMSITTYPIARLSGATH